MRIFELATNVIFFIPYYKFENPKINETNELLATRIVKSIEVINNDIDILESTYIINI